MFIYLNVSVANFFTNFPKQQRNRIFRVTLCVAIKTALRDRFTSSSSIYGKRLVFLDRYNAETVLI